MQECFSYAQNIIADENELFFKEEKNVQSNEMRFEKLEFLEFLDFLTRIADTINLQEPEEYEAYGYTSQTMPIHMKVNVLVKKLAKDNGIALEDF